jgi:alpha-galactosidase
MKRNLFTILLLAILMTSCQKRSILWLNEIDLSSMTAGTGKGTPAASKSVMNKPLSIAGQSFEKGIGTSAVSTFMLELNGSSLSISGKAGVDDEAKEAASVRFYLIGDHKILWHSRVMHKGDAAEAFNVKLKGIRKLGLLVTDAGDGIKQDYADWVDVSIIYSGKTPSIPAYITEEPYLLTPPAPVQPEINGPKIYGVRPGSPFLYRIPCTGERPITFSATSLPEGLTLNAIAGIITGRVNTKGTYLTTLHAKNAKGESEREFKIIVGENLMLTPSMGWNSWYIHTMTVNDSIMRNAADLMISSGMADYGYQYVNIDGGWNVQVKSADPILGGPVRDKSGKVISNKKFPDMKELTDYIHAKGLKAGIYTSPGTTDCGNGEGGYKHEALDASRFSEWGFDFLKYDWCSYENIAPDHSLESLKAPFLKMWKELRKQNRDIVFNLCQYGMGKVWTWGGEMGHSWRTTDDLGLMRGMSMPGFYYIGRSNADHWEYAKPGNWNDPDYILIGYVMDPFNRNQVVKADLNPSEQYFYMSMWSLMAAPLIFSGDMGRIDNFILNVLCNNEVINIDLDPLGRQGRIIREGNNEMVMVKELEDSSLAVGLFHVTGSINDPSGFPLGKEKQLSNADPARVIEENTDPAGYLNWGEPVKISISAKELGLSGKFRVRDVWRQKDLGEFEGKFEAEVPFHGVTLVRIMK